MSLRQPSKVYPSRRSKGRVDLPNPYDPRSPGYAERHTPVEVPTVGSAEGTVRFDMGASPVEAASRVPHAPAPMQEQGVFTPAPHRPIPDFKPGIGRDMRPRG